MGKATYTVTVTNNSNGVSVDYETETPMTLLVPEVAAEVIKDLVNTVRSYDTENEHDVCGFRRPTGDAPVLMHSARVVAGFPPVILPDSSLIRC